MAQKGTMVNLNVKVNREERRVKQRTVCKLNNEFNYTHSSTRCSVICTIVINSLCQYDTQHLNIKLYRFNVLGHCNFDGLSIV